MIDFEAEVARIEARIVFAAAFENDDVVRSGQNESRSPARIFRLTSVSLCRENLQNMNEARVRGQ